MGAVLGDEGEIGYRNVLPRGGMAGRDFKIPGPPSGIDIAEIDKLK